MSEIVLTSLRTFPEALWKPETGRWRVFGEKNTAIVQNWNCYLQDWIKVNGKAKGMTN